MLVWASGKFGMRLPCLLATPDEVRALRGRAAARAARHAPRGALRLKRTSGVASQVPEGVVFANATTPDFLPVRFLAPPSPGEEAVTFILRQARAGGPDCQAPWWPGNARRAPTALARAPARQHGAR